MIASKTFESIEKLNSFVDENRVKVISIETKEESYDTGLPLIHGGSFISKREVLKLWYIEKEWKKY